MKKYYILPILLFGFAMSFQFFQNKEDIVSSPKKLKNSENTPLSLVRNFSNQSESIETLETLKIANIENINKGPSRKSASIVFEKELTPLQKNKDSEFADNSKDDKESPQAVLDWSADIGFMMIKAFDDSQYADKVFRDLQNCSENKSLQMVFRAICAANMKRLSEQRGEAFGQRYASIHSLFPDEIKGFLEQAYTAF